MAKRWLITGVSSGIGKALMDAVIAHGDTVVGTVRKLPADGAPLPDNARLAILDVTDPASVARGVTEAVDWMGGVDVLVNNAGSGMFGVVEACSIDDFRKVLEVNYFGLISVTQAVLPHLRESKGTLVNLGSISSFIAMGGTAPYGSAKHAVLGLTESLHEELKPLGVKVIAAMPGGFRSHFWNEGSNTIREGLDDIYGKYPAGQIRARTQEHAGNEMGDPAKLASLLIELASHDDPPLFLMLGGDALEYASQKRDSLVAELEAYQAVGRATAFDS